MVPVERAATEKSTFVEQFALEAKRRRRKRR